MPCTAQIGINSEKIKLLARAYAFPVRPYMRLCSTIQTSCRLLFPTHGSFPSRDLLRNGTPWIASRPAAFTVAAEHEAMGTQITRYHHLISVLRNSKMYRSPRMAKMAHGIILRSGLESNFFVSNNLLHCYCSCGSIPHALHLFDGMTLKDAVSWNTMIAGFVRSGFFTDGLSLFREMLAVGIRPTQSSFASVLVASAEMGSSSQLVQVHCVCLKSGFSSDCCVGNALLQGLVEFRGLGDLRKLSDEMCSLDEISFEILLKGCTKYGTFSDAFELLRYSCRIGIGFSPHAFSSLISLCISDEYIQCGIQVHGHTIKVGLDMHISVVNSLIKYYSRSYRLEDAESLFDWCRSGDIVTWNSLISGFAYNGEGDAGVGLVQRLLANGTVMNESTFLSFLSCCAAIKVLKNAKKAHVLILKLREYFDHGIDNIALTMYCRCRSLDDAETLFEAMEVRDAVSFNLMMALYRNCGNYEESIMLFFQAQSEGLQADEAMLSCVICGCSKLGYLDIGQQIHGRVTKASFHNVAHLNNSLLEMYSQGGRFDDMEKAFQQIGKPDLFSWNMLLMGYARYGLLHKSIVVWQEMENSGVELNEFSYSALLDTCNFVSTLLTGDLIHGRIKKMGLVFDTTLMNSLLTMYSNCQMMDKALAVFKETSSPDAVSWNALVSGYARNCFADKSLNFYKAMNKNGIETNHMTFASISMCCAMLAELKLGSQVHTQIIKRAFDLDVSVSNSLITMYAKCGGIHDSSKIFERTVHRDVITWNSMICAYADHGHGRDAIDVFTQMIFSGIKPNNITFVGILSACSHAGLMTEACHLFNSMHVDHGIIPSEEHYICMTDILCRAGKLTEAKDLIESMAFDSCSFVWRTLLSACKVNENVKLGEIAAKRIIHLEPRDSASYVILSDLYASVGQRRNKAELRRLMRDRGVKKEVGCSWI